MRPLDLPVAEAGVDIGRRTDTIAIPVCKQPNSGRNGCVAQVEPSERSASSVQSAGSAASTFSGSGYGTEPDSVPASRVSSFSRLRPGMCISSTSTMSARTRCRTAWSPSGVHVVRATRSSALKQLRGHIINTMVEHDIDFTSSILDSISRREAGFGPGLLALALIGDQHVAKLRLDRVPGPQARW